MVKRYRRRTNYKTRKRRGRKNTRRRRKSRRKTELGGVYPGKRPTAPRKSFGKNSHRTKSLGILKQPKGMLHKFNQEKEDEELVNMFSGMDGIGSKKTTVGKKKKPTKKRTDDELAALTAAVESKLQLEQAGPAEAAM